MSGADSGTTLYCFDEFERMVTARGPGLDKETAVYDYDGFDRRDTKLERTSGGSDKRRDFAYVGTSRLLSREQSPEGKTMYYDYSSAGEREGQSKAPAGQSEPTVYRSYGTDANGSVEDLEEPDGSVPEANRYVYDPYGERDTAAGQDGDDGLSDAAKDNPFRFEGFYYDSGVKTYDMQARQYRPDTGRFLTQDRYQSASGDLNLQADPLTQNRYAFAGGNPSGYGRHSIKAKPSPQPGRAPIAGNGFVKHGGPAPAISPAEVRATRTTIRTDPRVVVVADKRVTVPASARRGLANQVARNYCSGGNLCSNEQMDANADRVYDALVKQQDIAKLKLDRGTTDVGFRNPVDLVGGGLGGIVGKLAVRGAAKAGLANILRSGAVGEGTKPDRLAPLPAGGRASARAPSTSFGRRVEDFQQNPDDWRRISAHAEGATGRRYRGGTSLEEVFERGGDRLVRHRIYGPKRRCPPPDVPPKCEVRRSMNGIEADVLELVQVAESPLYSTYRWLGREIGHDPSMAEFLQMVNHLIEDDVLRLWSVDPDSEDRVRLAGAPEELERRYAGSDGLDGSFDPFGLSLTLGPAAQPEGVPDWRIDMDFDSGRFQVEARPGFQHGALEQVKRFFPDFEMVGSSAETEPHVTRLSGCIIPVPEIQEPNG